jgi:4-azaleucine resistance transporter AzlC
MKLPAGEGVIDQVVLGARTVLPVVFGVIPFALVLGALAARQGLSVLEVGLMSAIVFAGSAQFAAVELWSLPPAIAGLALTALLINLRHVLMGIAIAPHLRGFSGPEKALALFWMADEIWALAMRRGTEARLTAAFYFGLGFVFWACWVLFSLVGAAVGGLIDDPRRWGFDFAFVAVFMVLLKSFWRGTRTGFVWCASAAASMAVWSLVDGPWYVLAGAAAGMASAALAPPATTTRKPGR